uniref:Methyltranfer_dom domain-containing protein n=1 Tax=Syphacia muris TaxID=451379 RepID=A0A0N5AT21_9BILA
MDTFSKQLVDITSGGVLCLGLALGNELKLFDWLAENSSETQPITASQLAMKTEMKERLVPIRENFNIESRYIKEWLCLMACGKFVEVTEDGEKFWIRKELVSSLSGESANPILELPMAVRVFGRTFPLLVDAFRADGPMGFETRNPVDNIAETIIKKHFLTDLMPLIGISERLKQGGAWVLNIGCGRGDCLANICKCLLCFECIIPFLTTMTFSASHFQDSFFVGVDSLIDRALGASKLRDEANEGLENLSFQQMDILNLKKEWNGKFDWGIVFNYCHCHPHSDRVIFNWAVQHLLQALKEIYRVLKEGGVLSMVETNGSGNVCRDFKENDLATLFYGTSLFSYLPQSLNSLDSVDATLSQGKLQKLLEYVGFRQIKCHKISFLSGYVLYVCQK